MIPRAPLLGQAIQRGHRFNAAELRLAWSGRRLAIYLDYRRTQSYAETGRHFGISRQRVEQIVSAWREAHES